MAFERLESYIFEKMSASKQPGLSAAIVRESEVIWARGFGFRDLAGGLPATPHTLYGIGSVTKSFTAMAIMQLAEADKLSLDDPVSQHLPRFTVQPFGETIRLWHLLTHTSGIAALASSESLIDGLVGAREHWLPMADADDVLTFMQEAETWALTRPGERWFYLNEGYLLLGRVVEVVSGEPFETYVHNHILGPLGMRRTFFQRADVEADPDAATPYLLTPDGGRRASLHPYRGLAAAGGLISNVLDMAPYITMLLDEGATSIGRLLSADSARTMQTPRTTMPLQGNPFGDSGYGLGLMSTPDFLGRELIGHGGSVGTSTAQMSYIPSEGLGIMLLANGSGPMMALLAMAGLAEALGEDVETLPFVRYEARLDELTGAYRGYKDTIRYHVRRVGEFLHLEEPSNYGTRTTILVVEDLGESRRLFYTPRLEQRLPVEFRVGEDGRIDLIIDRYLLRRVGPLP